MSKKHYHQKPPIVETPEPVATPEPIVQPNIPSHRQCPCCFGGRGGVGKEKWWRRVSGTLVRRCYACDQCGFQWTADVRTHSVVEKIEFQQIHVEHSDVDLETR